MKYNTKIHHLFREIIETTDKKYIRPWMIHWKYQDKLKYTNFRYGKGLPEDFNKYSGPGDLDKWLNWQTKSKKPEYFRHSQIRDLIGLSKKYDLEIAERYDLKFNFDKYDDYIGRNNAQDYLLTHLYPSPIRGDDIKVLDFGAGYGRQINLWSQKEKSLTFVGIDAIPKAYCLQHFYYSNNKNELNEYITNPINFTISEGAINHLPTWRFDLLPDNYFDQILCVQVLHELNPKLVKYVIRQFQRILKPGAAIYIRDHDQSWRPAHKINLNKYLESLDFVIEFKPHVVDGKDIHGIPRIWRKSNPGVVTSRKINSKQIIKEWEFNIDSLTRGRLKHFYRKYIKFKTHEQH